jgi:hypothetical protein
MADAAEKKRTLRSSDGEEFEVEEVLAMESQTIKHMIEDDCDGVIPLPNVNAKILSKVIEYCRKHVQTRACAAGPEPDMSSNAVDTELKTFDTDFVKVDQATLFDLILVRISSTPSRLSISIQCSSRLRVFSSDCSDAILLCGFQPPLPRFVVRFLTTRVLFWDLGFFGVIWFGTGKYCRFTAGVMISYFEIYYSISSSYSERNIFCVRSGLVVSYLHVYYMIQSA